MLSLLTIPETAAAGGRQPIVVTGAHRTGTTWVGQMVAAAPGVAYISEPLNVLHRPGVFRAAVPHWYTYITDENGAAFLPAYRALLAFRYNLGAELRSLRSPRDAVRMLRDAGTFLGGYVARRRPLLKDPFAVFSTSWLSSRFSALVIVTVRHPAGFASSLKRLGWSFDFGDLLAQPLLMRDHLEPYRGAMENTQHDDIVAQAALLWAMVYEHVQHLRAAGAELIVVRQEDLARDPVQGFRQLFEAAGLRFTPHADRLVRRSSSPENPAEPSPQNVHSIRLNSEASTRTWRGRLTDAEIRRVLEISGSTFRSYYPEAEWS